MVRFLIVGTLAASCFCAALGCGKDDTPKGVKDGAFQAKPLANPGAPGGGTPAKGNTPAKQPGGGVGAD